MKMNFAETKMRSSGEKALGNSDVVARLRNGGKIWPDTEKRLRHFMRQFVHAKM